jgi:hypothetical protein
MGTLTDAELEALLEDTESDRVERKAAWCYVLQYLRGNGGTLS